MSFVERPRGRDLRRIELGPRSSDDAHGTGVIRLGAHHLARPFISLPLASSFTTNHVCCLHPLYPPRSFCRELTSSSHAPSQRRSNLYNAARRRTPQIRHRPRPCSTFRAGRKCQQHRPQLRIQLRVSRPARDRLGRHPDVFVRQRDRRMHRHWRWSVLLLLGPGARREGQVRAAPH